VRIIFLAAGKSNRIFNKIKKNKCLINIKGKPLIELLIDKIKKTKINKISIITGFRAKILKKKLKNIKNIDFLFNEKFSSREMLYSLILGLKNYDEDILISYSDILFNSKTINLLLKKRSKEIKIPILKNWKKIWKIRNKDPLIDGETLFINNKGNLKSIGNKITDLKKVDYQYMGLIFIPKEKRKKVLSFYKLISRNKKMHATGFLNFLVKKKNLIKTVVVDKGWYEFDDYEDLINYKKNYF
jgi:choline kinase